ncbi:ribbon-helix-helix protein, CopG family [Cellvibrio japonicus]|uniref:ribbon-helix-helix protein, CopG family n=1 Tax=Cellvibrio japonicus TaxID=155077 RepID=UPI00059F9FF1|nr:ribbon-helix-helix protein, CopG family [Cellvibrio japonicus]QEI12109.1 ribbon-helix-helix protein, CopG family [Cellvibrio japonicus]QEI15683.1 ribbon-helix-helix protein, CopG family [Cellvibrio japonicus]QEI19261.1 ribbon-helix-helix protein, CopG family [Cellvibrio japonicus]
MGQVTIYLEDELEAKMEADAKARKISKSKWIATVIREKLTNEWPHEVRETAGSWGDFPSLEEIRGETHSDSLRESL